MTWQDTAIAVAFAVPFTFGMLFVGAFWHATRLPPTRKQLARHRKIRRKLTRRPRELSSVEYTRLYDTGELPERWRGRRWERHP